MSMSSVQTRQQLIQALEQMDAIELENIAYHVSKLRTRKVNELSAHEAELLKTARRRLSREFLHRYRELIAKRQAETLTEGEYQELLRLIYLSQVDDKPPEVRHFGRLFCVGFRVGSCGCFGSLALVSPAGIGV